MKHTVNCSMLMTLVLLVALCGTVAIAQPAPKDTPPIVGKWCSQIELKELDNGKIHYRMDFKEEDNAHTAWVMIANEESMDDPIFHARFTGVNNGAMTGGMEGVVKPSTEENPGDHIIGRFNLKDVESTFSSDAITRSFVITEFAEVTYYGGGGMLVGTPASMRRSTEISSAPLALDGHAFYKVTWEMPVVLDDYIAEYMICGITVFPDGTWSNPTLVIDAPVTVNARSGVINVEFDDEICERLRSFTHVYVQMLSAYGNCYGTMVQLDN